jgi:hypothetical protein
MSEQQLDVLQEVVNPEQSEVHEQEVVAQEQQEVQEETPKEDDPQERNWREARQALKELKRQNEYLKQKIEETQRHQLTKQQQEDLLAEDDFVQAKHLNKRLAELERKLQQKEQETVVDRLKIRCPDFEDVVTEENINYLKQNDPELAMSLQALQHDPFAQGMAAYKILKKTDYYQNKAIMQEKAKTQENAKKPVSVNAVRKQQGALAEANKFANGLTPDLKKSLWQEMQESRKRG